MRTIVVEDDKLVRLVLTRALEARGHKVLACESAEEALACYEAATSSLIIVDLNLPGMGGLELCARLRERGEDLYLLVVTAHDEALDEALVAGADDYLPKPFEQRTLEIRLRIAERNIAQLVRRREAERALLQAREDLRRVIDHLPAAVVIHHQGRVRYSNPAWLRLTGCERAEQMEGRELHDLLLPGDTPSHQRLTQHLRGESLPQGAALRLLRPDGEAVTLELAPPRALTWRHAPATLLVALDVTEREAIQARLFLTERMAAIGTMSAGIAHELNNPLTFILGNLGQLIEELEQLSLPSGAAREEFEEMLRESLQGAQRVAAIVQALRTYSGLGEEQQGEVPLSRALEMAVTMAGPALRQIELRRDLPANLPPLLTHEARLGQILYQLLLNAAQSISEERRGQIEVSARHHHQQIEVEVRDNGAGMSPEVLRRVFDPFFTTRGVHGAGLGLFVCHNLARSLGGELTLESAPGQGTTARLTLSALAPPRRHLTPPPSRAIRQILIIDPDAPVARSLKRALSAHHVILIESPYEARAQLQSERFDAVLCDLSGDPHGAVALYEETLRRDPAQAARFIWMLGGPAPPVTQAFLAQTTTPRLEKPFSIADLIFLLQGM